jgi:hypothetical protein
MPEEPTTLKRYLGIVKRKLILTRHPGKMQDKEPHIAALLAEGSRRVVAELNALIYEAECYKCDSLALPPEPDPCPISRAHIEALTPWSPRDRVAPAQEIISMLQTHGDLPKG